MKNLMMILVLVVMVGCAASGTRLEQAQIDKLKPGTTTKQEMYAMFGQPFTTGAEADGSTTALWNYHRVNSFAMYVGDSAVKSQVLSAAFDSNDVLAKYSLSDQVNKKPITAKD